MYPPVQHKSQLGILYIILGIIIFMLAAGELLLKLMFALAALWLIAYGVQVYTGKPVNLVFWRNLTKQ